MPTNSSVSTTTVNNPNAAEITGPIEADDVTKPLDESELGSHREEVEAAEDQTDQVPESEGEADEVPADKIPTRLKGKSLAQVYAEFAGLEKEYSRQGNELGEARGLLRQTLETMLEQNGRTSTTQDADEVTDEEISSNPKEAVKKLVKKELAPVEQRAATAEQKLMMMEFNERHPGYLDTVRTPEFNEWVSSSPYRQRVFKAAANYDMDAAEELFSEYERVQPAKKEPSEDPTVAKRREIRKASTVTGSAGKSVSSSGGKKIWTTMEIHRLYNTDREKYNELMPQITAAYREGRVRK